MAAAEARAAWQRTANRCFVQEDAKRAPKLACCPSSSAIPQHDATNVDGQDHPIPNFVPLNWNPKNSNLPPDTRWWLQLQPSFGYQQDFASEKLNALEDDSKKRGVESVDPVSTLRTERFPGMVSSTLTRKESETRVDEMKAVINMTQQPLKSKVDMGDYVFQDENFMDWVLPDRLISRNSEKSGPDIDSPWAVGTKGEPWWRISDRDELASLVAQKSLEQIENCDLPRPAQTVLVSLDPFGSDESLGGDKIFSNLVNSKLRSTSGSMDEKLRSSSDGSHLHSDTVKLYSVAQTCDPTSKELPESMQASEADKSRAQLLEALCHSQTRAREAEIAAQKAYDEKEHIVKLFFRQASHLFAYKQWLHMLQLESQHLQHKIKEAQISTLFPGLPWTPLKGEGGKRKKRKKCSFCKYVVAFAVGLGLAGAGLLLGWSLGWLLPNL